jgi:hypothetical protein
MGVTEVGAEARTTSRVRGVDMKLEVVVIPVADVERAKRYGCRFPGADGRVAGRAPGDGTYGSFLTFDDPDGNGWIVQEVTTRFPGRVEGDTTYASASDLAQALRRAATAHGEHEARTGQADAEWPDWYAEYMVKEQAGQELPL